MSTKQQRIAEFPGCPGYGFHESAHHMDIEWLLMAYARTRKNGAVGVDGQTADEYEVNLMANLQDLLDRADPAHTWHRLCTSACPQGGLGYQTRPLGIPR